MKPSTQHAPDTTKDNETEPPGGKNYLTPQGFAKLRAELKELTHVQRPNVVEAVHWAASNGDRSENGDYIYGKKRLREIDRRIRWLIKRLELAVVVDPVLHHGCCQIFFGASVTYLDEAQTQRRVRIVGIDEANSAAGDVSWVSPIGRTLLKAFEGDTLKLVLPNRVSLIQVVQVSYPAPVAT